MLVWLMAALTLALGQLSADQFVDPQLLEPRVKVNITGSVRKPGLYYLPAGSRIVDAIKVAGGPTNNASLLDLELADPLRDGESVRVPQREVVPHDRTGQALQAAQADLRAAIRGGVGEGLQRERQELTARLRGTSHRIDINRATSDQLQQLPGIGPGLAGRILAYRSTHGKFHNPQELREVSGIGERRLARWEPLIEAR